MVRKGEPIVLCSLDKEGKLIMDKGVHLVSLGDYYSLDDELKGTYVNINTPIEIYPDRARYIDLEVDVVKLPGQKSEIIDEEELKKANNAGIITDDFFTKIVEIANEIKEKA